MASTKESRKVLEGVFAINKPQGQSSAGVLRDLQTHFNPSSLFFPWLVRERAHLLRNNNKPNKVAKTQVKLGHGGTLDPLATGVLVVGVGKGTKQLANFLDCTKSYETVILFGAATDSYDCTGKIVSRAPYEHVTKELVQEKLDVFKGKIMQKPSVFSALKVDGKKMYEYARAGGEVPEVQARPVEVLELEMIEWLEPGSHEYKWPEDEVDKDQKAGAAKLIGANTTEETKIENDEQAKGTKRARDEENDDNDDAFGISNTENLPKKPKTDDEPAMSGALPVDAPEEPAEIAKEAQDGDREPTESSKSISVNKSRQPPAARLRMTVTSGFYVRSLCHDLGLACNSLGLMSSLIRTRQGDYSLSADPPNVLEYDDLSKGPEIWEPKVESFLEKFMADESWNVEEVTQDDVDEDRQKFPDGVVKGQGRDGGGGGGGKWRGKGKGHGGRRGGGGGGGGRRD